MSLQLLVDELLNADNEDHIAFRGQRRLVPRLRRHVSAGEPVPTTFSASGDISDHGRIRRTGTGGGPLDGPAGRQAFGIEWAATSGQGSGDSARSVPRSRCRSARRY